MSYQYFAIVTAECPVENPFFVVRTGGAHEEFFSTRLRWERSDALYRIQSGREYWTAVPISEEQGKGFEKVQAQRVAAARKSEGN
ncbi:hypothetical protein [Amycolatopsis sp. DG1A-15b]|uniref:hypothetical protein n=1 Tax=Amycolatopsis sp. DG1A-15b TaxID=3052846 RepID=UPI00255BD6AA|nr:hypothetical protein [Amycolatopsis sp. DG1A-15b]WIX85204.1 hypothetical protein QRY02_28675 [Amycolatopsis sp. DG1A-15b]